MNPVRLKKGQLIDTVDGVVDTWDWIIDSINGICGSGNISVTRSGTNITISSTGDDDDGDDDGGDTSLPDIPDVPPMDWSGLMDLIGQSNVTLIGTDGSTAVAHGTIRFVSASDSNVKVSVAEDGNGGVNVTIGVYYT